ncbi:MAG: leucine-rich repeat domain-containing protein, partial [Proteobacteria bacterium]
MGDRRFAFESIANPLHFTKITSIHFTITENLMKTLINASMILLLASAWASCTKKSSSILASKPSDTATSIIKIPSGEFSDVAGPFLPVISTKDYQRVQQLPIGYRILCSNLGERNSFLQGLGFDPAAFDSMEPAYQDEASPTESVVKLHLDSQPILRCPSDQAGVQEKPRLVQTLTNPPLFYVNYINSAVTGRDNVFYEVGCEGLIAGLGLNKETAVPINFALDRPTATKVDINCPNGITPAFNPFLAECESAMRSPNVTDDQSAYQTLMAELPGFAVSNDAARTCGALWNYVKGLADVSASSLVLESVKPMEYMTNVKTLDIHDNLLSSIEPLKGLTRLRTLDISENPDLVDLRPLENLKALSTLKALKTKIKDLRPLAKLSKLTLLEIDTRYVEPDKCPLDAQSEELVALCKTLNVSDFVKSCEEDAKVGASDRTVYHHMKRSFNKQTCFELNEAVKNITSISIVNTGALVDVSGLQYLTQLNEIDLRGNKIESLDQIASKLVNLRTLNASNNLIKDIKGLANLSQLANLDLSQNQITDARALSLLPVWLSQSLNLQGNPIQQLVNFKDWCRLTISTDIAATVSEIKTKVGTDLCTADDESLANIKELNLDGKNLRTLAPLGSLTGLTRLSARYNEANSGLFLATLAKLEYLDISNNKLTDLSA